ncbi:Gfo/Idh/MocA family oxidoreductase [Lichenihabitans sp. Uapishka_5]|uniref:Gfo/Idh/MocA family protein n=1 Tax=Lichenihabitans sp. Uapishka_5 TaxID=3037302 RepID=UPI0029E804C6|nr:Gfo/Idh/MocA family oxidoreductase [Lichenihabitans sp. Uapishka_5]MDX7953498.1 Gfo/Idh/MocA family oxidoreductase [Lichenihabitans sp. Uapishka_5]
MTSWNGAIVGCGFFAHNHLHGWGELKERCAIRAVCDIDGGKAQAAADAFGIPNVYTNIEELLARETLDFVDIVTTAPSHRALVEACARRGVATVVQKPLAPDWADASALVATMDRAGRPLMVHENFRFQAPLSRAADVLRSGVIGEAVWGQFSFRTGYDIYAGQPYLAEVERFVLLDLAIHVLDIARVFMGEAETVACRSQSVRPGIKGEDMATVMLGHRGGATSIVDVTYASRQTPDPFPQTLLHVDGRQGSIRLDREFHLTVTTPEGTTREVVAPHASAWMSPQWVLIQDSVVATQRHWLDCLDGGAEPATSGRDNLKTFALVEASYRSAAAGGSLVTPEVF